VSRVAVRTPGAALPARPRLLGPTLVVVALVLLLGGVGIALYTDLLWFRDVGFSEVFSTVLRTKLLLFSAFGLLMAVLVGANITLAYRLRPPFRPMSLEQQNLERYRLAVEPYLVPVLLLASGVFGVFAGLSAASRWQTWLLWRNATPFGVEDPQFGRDISYFAFTYPFQRFVLTFVLTAVVLSLLAAAVTHYLFGGVRLQTVGEKVSPAARAHLSVLLGVIVLLKAVAYYLDRFGLAFSTRGRVQGASYTDVNAVLPAKNILIGVAVICALLFFANTVIRNIVLPAGALALLVLSAVVLGGVYPAYTQQFRVKPNEVEREAEYIERGIVATRAAYGIDKAQVTTYDAKATSTAAQLRSDRGTIPNARLLDPNILSPTFTQKQRLSAYYQFNPSLDIDRYDFGKGVQDYVVGVRELRLAGLAAEQRNWINEHLTYTHGNGFVAAPASQVVEQEPVFEIGGLPVRGPAGLGEFETRIYFGEGTTDYSVVGTDQDETDGPEQGADVPKYSYDGPGGVELNSFVRKAAYALKFREKNLLLSGLINETSQLQYIRTPRERVQKVAPFLQLDRDPYPAVVDGKVLWIVDGYTTSAGYPYSERTTLGDVVLDSQTTRATLPQQQVNYIRNSVKATVDAFSGEVKLYTFDSDDPVLRTWAKAFPGVLEDESAISDELRDHFRYPEDLFKVQRDLLGRYHITDAREFYQGDDYWQVPGDPASARGSDSDDSAPAAGPGQNAAVLNASANAPDQPPYYVLSQFPGTTRATFNLTTAFTGRRSQNLTAVAAVSSDPEDYGTIRVLQLPRTVNIEGPRQVANRFNTDGGVRLDLLPLFQGGARVKPGNLLTLPVGGGLLYVQPIYVQAQSDDSFPTLQLVLAAFGERVTSAETLGEALDELFGAGAGSGVEEPGASPGPTPTASPSPGTSTIAQAIADAQAAFARGEEALRRGDFAAYGRAQAELEAALARLAAANGSSGGSASPSATPTPSPSGG
jgi:uncharacterized protein